MILFNYLECLSTIQIQFNSRLVHQEVAPVQLAPGEVAPPVPYIQRTRRVALSPVLTLHACPEQEILGKPISFETFVNILKKTFLTIFNLYLNPFFF